MIMYKIALVFLIWIQIVFIIYFTLTLFRDLISAIIQYVKFKIEVDPVAKKIWDDVLGVIGILIIFSLFYLILYY